VASSAAAANHGRDDGNKGMTVEQFQQRINNFIKSRAATVQRLQPKRIRSRFNAFFEGSSAAIDRQLSAFTRTGSFISRIRLASRSRKKRGDAAYPPNQPSNEPPRTSRLRQLGTRAKSIARSIAKNATLARLRPAVRLPPFQESLSRTGVPRNRPHDEGDNRQRRTSPDPETATPSGVSVASRSASSPFLLRHMRRASLHNISSRLSTSFGAMRNNDVPELAAEHLLTREEVLAVRLYTGPGYAPINGWLRQSVGR